MVQHAGTHEKRQQVRRDVREELLANVGGDDRVVAAEAGRRDLPIAQRKCREANAGRPALGSRRQRVDLVLRQVEAGFGEMGCRLAAAERELARMDLHDPAPGSQRADRDCRLAAGAQHELRSR